jgi:Ser/Thr protein kinase RdoA (MazF antagonist)
MTRVEPEQPPSGPAQAGPARAGRAGAEEVLPGGNVSGEVIRVGGTVRKRATPGTPAVEALLAFLNAAGFAAAPRTLGLDERGRHVLEYVPGSLADTLPPLEADGLHRAGRVIRELHDTTAGFTPPPGARWNVVIPPDRRDLICHHDLAPWNLVCDGDRWVFIDWDLAGPGSRLWDLAHAAAGFVPLAPGGDPAADGPRLRALADGYGLGAAQRAELPGVLAARVRAMYDLLRRGARNGEQPWAGLYAAGHGGHWGAAAGYIDRHRAQWARALTR